MRSKKSKSKSTTLFQARKMKTDMPYNNLGNSCWERRLAVHTKMWHTCLREARRWALMKKQNVTLFLPKSLSKKVKIIAASKEKSMSELLRESLKKGFGLGTKGRIIISSF